MAGAADDAVRPAGTAGLTEAHRRAWASGAASLESIAAELGCSKQAVFKAFRKRGWTKADTPASNPVGPAPASAPADTDPTRPAKADGPPPILAGRHPANDWLMSPERCLDAAQRAVAAGVQINLAVLSEASGLIGRNRGNISPVVLQRIQMTSEKAVNYIIGSLLHPADDGSEDSMTKMNITVMSKEEEASIREAAEKEYTKSFGDADLEDEPASEDAGGNDRHRSAAPTPEPAPPRQAPAALNKLRIVGGLPGRQSFKPWLEELSRDKGARFVRQIGEAVGLKISAGEAVELVVDRIVHQLDGDPERLRRHVEIVE